jgi:hypothetical protein
MKRLIAVVLSVCMLFTSVNTAFATETSDDEYYVALVEYSDNIGIGEELDVLIANDCVYANAETLGKRLGYQVIKKDDCITIYNTDDETLPQGFTVFYYDSTKVEHTVFNMKMSSYESPAKCISNDKGVWIPLEYALLILNSGMMITDNTVCIDIPEPTVLDIYRELMSQSSEFLFDWGDDFGYEDLDWEIIGASSHMVNLLNGLLKKDGTSWLELIQTFAMDSSAYDEKYGQDIAKLFCIQSDDEFQASVKDVQEKLSYFSADGALGKTLSTIQKQEETEIAAWTKTCNDIMANVQAGNTPYVMYNKAYQQLERACDEANWFAETGGTILEVQKGFSEATGALNTLFTMAEVVGYADEFKNQDEYSVDTLNLVMKNMDSQSVMSKNMQKSISDYIALLETDITDYTATRYFEENIDDWILKGLGVSEELGTEATLALIAWNLASDKIPFINNGLNGTDKFELTLYASLMQSSTYLAYQNKRDAVFADESQMTAENLYEVSQYCYAYLKSCYITRAAALGSLTGKMESVKEQIQPLIDYENQINADIAEYLVKLKEVKKDNSTLCFGFLPENNEDYLKSKSNMVNTISEICYNNSVYNSILQEYQNACGVESNEYLVNLDKYMEIYPDVNPYVLLRYHEAAHYSEGKDEPFELKYTFFDIDGNGTQELIIAQSYVGDGWADQNMICDIYTTDGNSPIKLFDEITLLQGTVDIPTVFIFDSGLICCGSGDGSYYKMTNDGNSIVELEYNDPVINNIGNPISIKDTDWIILAEDIPVGSNLYSEEALHRIFRNHESIDDEWLNEIYFYYDDFDENGTNEAFGITGNSDGVGGITMFRYILFQVKEHVT